jgi:hypothetical protein
LNLLSKALWSVVPVMLPAGASTADDSDMAFRGLGLSSCEDFTKHVDGNALLSGGKKKEGIIDSETAFYTWAQGLWTDMNRMLVYTGQQSTNLNIRPMQEQKNHLYDFCIENPNGNTTAQPSFSLSTCALSRIAQCGNMRSREPGSDDMVDFFNLQAAMKSGNTAGDALRIEAK